jgi:hypothetical protein
MIATAPAQPGTRSIVKMAYAVEDVRSAAAGWSARLGAGPFFVKDHISMSDAPGRCSITRPRSDGGAMSWSS